MKTIALLVLVVGLFGCGSPQTIQQRYGRELAGVRVGMPLEEFRETVPSAEHVGREGGAEKYLLSHHKYDIWDGFWGSSVRQTIQFWFRDGALVGAAPARYARLPSFADAGVRLGMTLDEFRDAVPEATVASLDTDGTPWLMEKADSWETRPGELDKRRMVFRFSGGTLQSYFDPSGRFAGRYPSGPRQIESPTTDDWLRQMRQQDQERHMRDMESRIQRLEAEQDW